MNTNDNGDFSNAAEVAMNLHYLAEAILKHLSEDECIGDIFGIGEDDFIMELYPYANLIVQLTDKAYFDGKQFSGVFVYDCMEVVAQNFWFIVENQDAKPLEFNMPDIDAFKLKVLLAIECA